MTRADLIDELSKAFSFTERESEYITTTIFETVTEALVRGEKVELRGFGSLRIRHRKPRAARNPKTGAAVDPTKAGAEIQGRAGASAKR